MRNLSIVSRVPYHFSELSGEFSISCLDLDEKVVFSAAESRQGDKVQVTIWKTQIGDRTQVRNWLPGSEVSTHICTSILDTYHAAAACNIYNGNPR